MSLQIQCPECLSVWRCTPNCPTQNTVMSPKVLSASFEAVPGAIPYQEGIKHDQGKAPLSMIPKEALEIEAKVLAYGATKYGKDNYKAGMNWSRILDAMLRHTYALAQGEDLDPESGLPHLGHIRACTAMLAYYMANSKGRDDR